MKDILFKDLSEYVGIYADIIDVLVWDEAYEDYVFNKGYFDTILYDIMCDFCDEGYSFLLEYKVSEITASILDGKSHLVIELRKP